MGYVTYGWLETGGCKSLETGMIHGQHIKKYGRKIFRLQVSSVLVSASTLKCLSIGTPKAINFPFGINGKLMVLGVPILEHIRNSSGE